MPRPPAGSSAGGVSRTMSRFKSHLASGLALGHTLSHPNLLTLFRVAAVPVIVILMLFPTPTCSLLAAIFFSAASITDYFDGFLARRRGLVSDFGKVMDPIADKLLVSSAFIMMAALDRVPAWLVCVIVGRELAVSGLRNIVAEKGRDVSAANLGKYKTGFQIAAAIPLLIHYPFLGLNVQAMGALFMWLALIFTVWSGAFYFIKFRGLLKV